MVMGFIRLFFYFHFELISELEKNGINSAMSIILSPKLSKCCLCYILSYMHYHSFSLSAPSSLPIPIYFSLYIHTYIHDPLFLNISMCIFKDKDVVLHKHSALIKIKKLTLIHHYHLIQRSFQISSFFSNVLYNKEQNLLSQDPIQDQTCTLLPCLLALSSGTLLVFLYLARP